MNRTVNGALREVVHRLQQGVFYFKNVRFYCTRVSVISFGHRRRRVAFPAPFSTKFKNSEKHYMHITQWLREFTVFINKCGKGECKLIYAPFSRNPGTVGKYVCVYVISCFGFYQTGRKVEQTGKIYWLSPYRIWPIWPIPVKKDGCTSINSSPPLSKVWLRGSIFIKLAFTGQLFVKDCYAGFHENPASGLVDTRLQAERRAWWSPRKAFFF
jgi:hypothetical protein